MTVVDSYQGSQWSRGKRTDVDPCSLDINTVVEEGKDQVCDQWYL